MVPALKKLLKKLVPQKYQPHIHLLNWLSSLSNGSVISGPFKGMKYVQDSTGSAYYPKIVGTYEMELNHIIDSLIHRDFKTILNIGAGEGYYAVGFGLKCHDSKIFAFEAEENGQRLLTEMARINKVETQILVRGHCDVTELRDVIRDTVSPLVIMDIEGGEKELLDPEKIPEFANSHILVELHDFAYRDISEIITTRFKETHEISEIWSKERTLTDFPYQLPFIYRTAFRKHFLYFMNEGRGERMRWYYLKPLTDNGL